MKPLTKVAFNWLGGLIQALAGAIYAGVPPTLVDNRDFNFYSTDGFHKILLSAGVGASLAFFHYLQAHPLPGWASSETTTTTVINTSTSSPTEGSK